MKQLTKVLALALTILALCGILTAAGLAETVCQDGIEVTLTTDKDSYTALEPIDAKLTVKNTNDYPIRNVHTKITVPDGYELLSDGEMIIDELAPDGEQTLQASVRETPDTPPALPQTGDRSLGVFWLLLFAVSAGALVILAIRHHQVNRVVSLLLCCALISSFAPNYAASAYAEKTEKRITVKKGVSVDQEPVTVTGIVTYDYDGSGTPPASPASDFEYYVIDSTSCMVTGYTGPDTDIVIPRKLDGYVVKELDGEAFEHYSKLTSIYVPESVTVIGAQAFANCRRLKSVSIPGNITLINDHTFADCISLKSITIPDSVAHIGIQAFYNCSSLKSITIPDSVTEIDNWAFQDCSNLTSITIPDSVTSIGYEAFVGCNKLTIYGKSGSYAEEYADDNDIPFVAIDASDDDPSENPNRQKIIDRAEEWMQTYWKADGVHKYSKTKYDPVGSNVIVHGAPYVGSSGSSGSLYVNQDEADQGKSKCRFTLSDFQKYCLSGTQATYYASTPAKASSLQVPPVMLISGHYQYSTYGKRYGVVNGLECVGFALECMSVIDNQLNLGSSFSNQLSHFNERTVNCTDTSLASYADYAFVVMGDAVRCNGHVVLVSENHPKYFSDGRLDVDNSYMIVYEQTVPSSTKCLCNTCQNGITTTIGTKLSKYTYKKLASNINQGTGLPDPYNRIDRLPACE